MNKKDVLKDSFSDIFSVPERIESSDSSDIFEKPDKPVINNYAKQRDKFHVKAEKTIKSLLDFYLQEKVISEDDYIKQKASLESSTMSSLLNQIELSQQAIDTLMNNIALGDMTPRMFEVLAGMQGTFIELLKMKSIHMIQMEQSVKQLLADRDLYQSNNDSKNELEQESGTTVRGSKKLMQQIQSAIQNKDIQDIAYEE